MCYNLRLFFLACLQTKLPLKACAKSVKKVECITRNVKKMYVQIHAQADVSSHINGFTLGWNIFICDTYQWKICLFRSGREMFSLFVWSLVLPSFLHHLLPFNKNNLRIGFLIKIAKIHNVKTEYLYSVLMKRELLVFLSPMSYLLFEFRTRKFRSQSMNG